MDQPSTVMEIAENAQPNSIPDTRLHGFWLVLARIAWLLVVATSLVVSIGDIPLEFARLRIVCVGSSCSGQQLTVGIAQQLHQYNLSIDFFATYFTVVEFGYLFVWVAVALVIFWRRSDDRMALLVTLFLVLFSAIQTGAAGTPDAVSATHPFLQGVAAFLDNLGWLSFVLFFYLFPNGHFVPRWTRMLVFPYVALNILLIIPIQPRAAIGQFVSLLSSLFLVALVVIGLLSQIYRYRRVSNPVQRQQTKWVVYGVVAAILLFALLISIGKIFANTPALLPLLIINTAIYGSGLLIPLSIGFSALRYRLYGIDVLINRTLVYGTLTALLVLIYFGLIFALQYLLHGIIENNDVAIVISTLGIVALFQPLRRRIQRVIDRRFYRQKYDAARTLSDFSATLRSEVDLNTLSDHLLGVVQETMQPAHVSLWLTQAGKDDKAL